MASKPEPHVLIVGIGKVGYCALELFHRLGVRTSVITRDISPEFSRRVHELAYQVTLADARMDEDLMDSGLMDVSAVIIATSIDLINLEVALDIRRLNPSAAIVLRMSDRQLADRVRKDIRPRAVFNAADLAAPAFVAAAMGSDYIRTLDVEDAFVSVESYRNHEVEKQQGVAVIQRSGAQSLDGNESRSALGVIARAHGSGEAQKTFGEARGRGRSPRWVRKRIAFWTTLHRLWVNSSGAMKVVAILLASITLLAVVVFRYTMNLSWVDSIYFVATMISTVGFGDINLGQAPPLVKLFGCLVMLSGMSLMVVLFSIITSYTVTRQFDEALGKAETNLSNHVIVIGLGSVGESIARRLRELRIPVLAIDRSQERKDRLNLPADIQVLVGDGGSPTVLEQAGVERARAVIAASSDDRVNLRVAHMTEGANPETRTIVRVFHSLFASKVGASLLSIDSTLNPSEQSATAFVAAALAPDVIQAFTLNERLVILRWIQGDALCGCRTTGELTETHRSVPLLWRNPITKKLEVVRPDHEIKPEDQFVALDEYAPGAKIIPCLPG